MNLKIRFQAPDGEYGTVTCVVATVEKFISESL